MSLKPEHLTRLAALNLSAESLREVLSILADTHAPSAGAHRQARYRARKNGLPETGDATGEAPAPAAPAPANPVPSKPDHVTSDVTSDATGDAKRDVSEPAPSAPAFSMGEEDSILPPEKATLSTPKGDKPKSDPRSRGCRLPEDWRPNDDGRKLAVDELGSNAAAHAELARFRDHWTAAPGAKGRKADWDATWRNWVRTAAERQPRGPPVRSSPRPAPFTPYTQALKEIYDECAVGDDEGPEPTREASGSDGPIGGGGAVVWLARAG